MSPIGGLVKRVTAEDDFGLLVELAPAAGVDTRSFPAGVDTRSFPAPLSPGLFSQVHVRSVTPIPFGVAVPRPRSVLYFVPQLPRVS